MRPTRLANTTSPLLGWDWITAQAASDKARCDAPILVSVTNSVLILQLGLRLIHQLNGGIGCGTASAEWTYRMVMLCVLCPSKDAMVGSIR